VADAPTARKFTSAGAAAGDFALDEAMFGIEPNESVLHQVVTAQRAAARSGTANTKTRAEVRGGGRKPWRQKGLGRARQGSIRSPQWKGGGVVFGPKPRSYAQRTPRKMRRLALRSALSIRASEDRVLVVEAFDWEAPKTRDAAALLAAMEAAGKTLVVLNRSDLVAERSFRNLEHVNVLPVDQLNPYDVMWADQVLFTEAAAGMVGGGAFEPAADDFVRDDSDGGEAA
jgi:large subunit ribosomal protein L4